MDDSYVAKRGCPLSSPPSFVGQNHNIAASPTTTIKTSHVNEGKLKQRLKYSEVARTIPPG
eukprot:scaffold18476_cov67-Skeletonema_dohrnii-CCMP3373.AAC.1